MKYNDYTLEELDNSLRYEFATSIEEFIEVQEIFNELSAEDKKQAFKIYEEGNYSGLSEQLMYFSKKLEDDYGIDLDIFIHIYHQFKELSDEAQNEAQLLYENQKREEQ